MTDKASKNKVFSSDTLQLSLEGELYQQKLEKLHRFLAEQEKPLIADLELAGFQVSEVSYLKTKYKTYKAAIPVLLKHMQLPYHENIGEMIARALAVPEAQYAWDTIVEEYRKAPDLRPDGINSYRKDALAIAVDGAMPAEKWNEYLNLIRDKSNGTSRVLMLEKIMRSKRDDRETLLEELSKDHDLAAEIAKYWKRKIKAEKRRVLAAAKKNLQ